MITELEDKKFLCDTEVEKQAFMIGLGAGSSFPDTLDVLTYSNGDGSLVIKLLEGK